jgi:hypothetical protein
MPPSPSENNPAVVGATRIKGALLEPVSLVLQLFFLGFLLVNLICSTLIMCPILFLQVVGAFDALNTSLVMVLASSPYPSLAACVARFIDDRHLAEEAVRDLDATHRVAELSAAWADLTTRTTSFGELLQVSAFSFFSS